MSIKIEPTSHSHSLTHFTEHLVREIKKSLQKHHKEIGKLEPCSQQLTSLATIESTQIREKLFLSDFFGAQDREQ
jgi:hypothetical protein